MHKQGTSESTQEAERRSGADRRNADDDPPGKYDRRRGLESRQPEVVELDLSDSEWVALTKPAAPAK